MNYEKLIRELVDKKSQQDNQIDLHAYENGMRALADVLSANRVVGRFYTEAEIKEVKETEYKKGLYFEGY